MVARLENAELQKYLEDEVATGRFASIDAAIEAAVWRMKQEAQELEPLDEETLAAIDAAEASHARGESRPWEEVRAELLDLLPQAKRL